MSIERAIYGSLKVGIESKERGSGYQYFTYTPGYKNLVKNNAALEGRLTSLYEAPRTFVSQDWYYNETQQTLADRNRVSEMVADEHPRLFAYWNTVVDGKEKGCFAYGKNMGHDWSEARPDAVYQSSVVCDIDDVKKLPILYSSSPSVCCEILRREFFKEDGNVEIPSMLEYTSELSDDNKGLRLNYSAGFSDITNEELVLFLREQERHVILQKMVYALMKKYDGDERCRLVIADQKENIRLWIACISMVFPLESAKRISFCTYEFKPSVGDFDINGVFVPELNGVKIKDEDQDSVTYYRFEKVCQESDAVFEFLKGVYAPELEVPDTSFYVFVDKVFRLNRLVDLDAFKSFIEKETTYRKIGCQYATGYTLFDYLRRNRSLDDDQFSEALNFSQQFAKKELIIELLEKIKTDYTDILQSKEKCKALKALNAFAVSKGFIKKEDILTDNLNLITEQFVQLDNTQKKAFVNIVSGIADICNVSGKEMHIGLIIHWGLEKTEVLTSQTDIIWKQMFVLECLCDFANSRDIDFLKNSSAYRIIRNIFRSIENEEVDRVRMIIDSAIGSLSTKRLRIGFPVALYMIFMELGNEYHVQTMKKMVVNIYYLQDNKLDLLNCLAKAKVENVFIPEIISSDSEDVSISQKINGLRFLLDYKSQDLGSSVDDISNTFVGMVRNAELANSNDKNLYLELYYGFAAIDAVSSGKYNNEAADLIVRGYCRGLAQAYPDLLLPDDEFENLRKVIIWNMGVTGRKDADDEVKAFFNLYRFKRYVKRCTAEPHKVGSDKDDILREFSTIDIVAMSDDFKENYLKGIGNICFNYFDKLEVLVDQEILNRLLLKKDSGQIMEIFTLFFDVVMTDVLKIESSKSRGNKLAYLYELSVWYEKKKMLMPFLERYVKRISRVVKQSEIIKVLEKDIEDLEKDRLNAPKWGDPRMKDIVGGELLAMIENLKYEYKNSGDPVSANGAPFGFLKKIFKKRGDEDE